MVVASANDFQVNQKKYLDLVKQDIQVFLKRGKELETTPFSGVGKPHQLKHDYSGKWSRHLNKKDVIIYSVNEDEKIVQIYTARYHYLDK